MSFFRLQRFKTYSVTAAEWDRIVESTPHATFSQTRIWHELWAELERGRTEAIHLELESGQKLLLPGNRIRILKGLQTRWISSPNGIGGPLSECPLSAQEEHMLWGILGQRGSMRILANPYQQTWSHPCWDQTHATQYVDLKRSQKEIEASFSSNHRRNIQKSYKHEVWVRQAQKSDEWETYYRIYLESIQRWGELTNRIYPLSLFQKLFKLQHPGISLWLAHYQDQAVSGALCFSHNQHVCYWHGANLKAFFFTGAGHRLHAEIIASSREQAYLYYDMNQSLNLPALIQFKAGFGAQKLPVPSWTQASALELLRSRFFSNPYSA